MIGDQQEIATMIAYAPSMKDITTLYASILPKNMELTTEKESKELKPKLVLVITGVSGSGKDTIASYLTGQYWFRNVKFSGETKRHIEDCLCLPEGSMDDREFRTKLVRNPITGENESFTYLDILIQEYRYRVSSATPWLTVLATGEKILFGTQPVAITDTRSPWEAKSLRSLERKNQICLKHIRVYGRGVALESDEYLTKNEEILPVQYFINNRSTLTELHENIDVMLHSINRGVI